jgi:hypothetical protein
MSIFWLWVYVNPINLKKGVCSIYHEIEKQTFPYGRYRGVSVFLVSQRIFFVFKISTCLTNFCLNFDPGRDLTSILDRIWTRHFNVSFNRCGRVHPPPWVTKEMHVARYKMYWCKNSITGICWTLVAFWIIWYFEHS